MAKAVFFVRSVVPEADRKKFEHWYATDHLPWAMREFKADRAWRFWSAEDAAVHYAVYQFADIKALEAGLASSDMKALRDDFDRVFPAVTRTRDKLEMVEERDA